MGVWVVRMRWAVAAALVVLGYFAPWDKVLQLDGTGPNAHLWGVLAVQLGKTSIGITGGFEAVLIVGIALALTAALLRTVARARGSNVLGAAGAWLNVTALALLMPVSGAVFAVVTAAAWEWVVLRAEGLRGHTHRWLWAVVGEIYCWGVAGSFAVAGWAYNAGLLVRCVVIAAGVGLVVQGVLPGGTAREVGSEF